jgi:hypothetical protein
MNIDLKYQRNSSISSIDWSRFSGGRPRACGDRCSRCLCGCGVVAFSKLWLAYSWVGLDLIVVVVAAVVVVVVVVVVVGGDDSNKHSYNSLLFHHITKLSRHHDSL